VCGPIVAPLRSVSPTIVPVGFRARVSCEPCGQGATNLADAAKARFRDGAELSCETSQRIAYAPRATSIKRSRCRHVAVWRLSVEAMTVGYERAYDEVIAGDGTTGSPANSGGPETLMVRLEPGV
jgi:hypothetical protein